MDTSNLQNDKMKVLFIQDSLGTGGAERSNANFWYYLREKGVEPSIIVLKSRNEGIQKEILNAGFNVTFLKSKSRASRIREVISIVDEFKPDIVYTFLFEASLIARGVKFFRKFILIENLVNETYSKLRLKDPNVNIWKLETYRLIDFITQLFTVDHYQANGLSVSEHYKKKLLVNSRRISIINRGRSTNRYVGDEALRTFYRNDLNVDNKLVFINVARHEFQKGQDTLLDSLNELPKTYLSQIKVLLVGRDGELSKTIAHKILSYGLEDVVTLLGHRDDVVKLLVASDVFVFPSRFEGLPGSLIEAEAAGLPIICSDINNNMEVVRINENALVFNVNDHVDLAAKIKLIIENPEIRKSFGLRSLEIFNEKFEISNIHNQMFRLLQEKIN
ncbi:glycosyltransferase family 4 protein [Marinigracilibium pacificum]|uniref:Glycosyltransferase family 4 protein n=1 Tax=Marinigracilibium pacificum TaxID=2729599 RepID=A0A848IU70_9BACT|nr:glycosyltransferase family 4 protein [Marinigracilibium pacificum]NMM48043.1 glycosyltransferase family 4 protein [Marinigracilibium pacificum]